MLETCALQTEKGTVFSVMASLCLALMDIVTSSQQGNGHHLRLDETTVGKKIARETEAPKIKKNNQIIKNNQ